MEADQRRSAPTRSAVPRIATFGDIAQFCVIRTIRRTTFQNEAPVAIAAIDVAMLIDPEIYARMTERRGPISGAAANGTGPVTRHATGLDRHYFGRRDIHGPIP